MSDEYTTACEGTVTPAGVQKACDITTSSRGESLGVLLHHPPHDPSLVHTQSSSLSTSAPHPYTLPPQHHTPTPSHPHLPAHIHLGLSSMRSLFRRMSSGIAFRVSSSKDCMHARGERTLGSMCSAKRQPADARTEPSQPEPAGPYLQAKDPEHLFNVLGPRTNVTRYELVSGREDPRDLLQLHQSRRPPRPARSHPPPAAAAPAEGSSRYCRDTTPQRHRTLACTRTHARPWPRLAQVLGASWRKLAIPWKR